jgi:hypothetical protein
MDATGESRRPARTIDTAAKVTFLATLRRGATREDAAAEAGFSLTGLYGARRRDPVFAADWATALATPPAAERRAKAYEERGEPGEVRIAPANRRFVQRRRRRHVRFTAGRRAVCLAHLAATADTKAAAAAAGICEATVHNHCRTDPAFAALYRETLAAAGPRLEAEALHLALMAQARLRHALEEGIAAGLGRRPAPCPHCGHSPDEAETFDRTMRLLARRDRKQRNTERRFKPGGRRQAWTFEESIEALEKYLAAMGVRILEEGEIQAALQSRGPEGDPSQSSYPGAIER